MPKTTAHADRFALENLPPTGSQPEYLFELPGLSFGEGLNCGAELLDKAVTERGWGERRALLGEGVRWTYRDLFHRANQIARVLVEDMGLVPGNRVLLRGPNDPMMAACWLAVAKAGGIAVTTPPLLRSKELTQIVSKARITHALCDARSSQELAPVLASSPFLRTVRYYNDPVDGIERELAAKDPTFLNAPTRAEDVVLVAFTSGTTGEPKATVHFHRDVMAICECFPMHVLKGRSDDIYVGSPSLGFTFGLGALLLFPLRIGAAAVLVDVSSPDALLAAIERYGGTICFSAPTGYRAMASSLHRATGTLRKCVSAGEALPASTRAMWKSATGIDLIDGIGTTEMLHIFISADEASSRSGSTGRPIPGYHAAVLDREGMPVPRGTPGGLGVRGPTGCRYLADERQSEYVVNGWNMTGDVYVLDEEGYFVYQGRADDMIISSGYNISPAEVENALLLHPSVAECAVVGDPDELRGQIVRACVVLRQRAESSPLLAADLKEFVKKTIAPYKYPRAIEFYDRLPKTVTGKLQRKLLRQSAA
jgi:2-aminobenzoate-CoA ligase